MRTDNEVKKAALDLIKTAAVVLAAFLAGYIHGSRRAHERPEPEPIKVDTLWVRDTVKVPEPVPVDRWLTRTEYIPVHDTTLVHLRDTAFLPVPVETTLYQGEDYEAWVTGFRATLDSINIIRTTEIIEKTVPVYRNRKWGVGLQAGVTWSKDTKIAPYVGVGVSYNILSF